MGNAFAVRCGWLALSGREFAVGVSCPSDMTPSSVLSAVFLPHFVPLP
jgi:hypothetical protein